MNPKSARWRSNRWAVGACVGLGLLLTGCAGSPAPTLAPTADPAPSATLAAGPDQEWAVAAAWQFFDQKFADEYRRRARIEVSRTDNGWWLVAFRGVNVPCSGGTKHPPIRLGMCRDFARPDEQLAFEDYYVCVDPRDLTAGYVRPGLSCGGPRR